eukprot:gene14729-19487_t
MDGVYPGYLGVRHTLYLEADASPEQLAPVIAEAQRCSPYLHVFADPQPLQGSVLRVQRYGWDRASARYEDLWREALAPATRG